MRAFIIRPFATQQGIDFDAVERLLINPALERFSISGRTTMEILRQGNIRLDMFQRLLTADLVIADVSIHNANVFYELGIRHALRDRRTFLIRCQRDDIKAEDVPFDIRTDRYLTYPKDDPAARLPDLIEGLRQTINSEAKDSPVFMLLPELEAQDRSHFLPVPLDFREEVERAASAKEVGDLGLLAEEAKGFEWEIEGLRIVGRAQFDLKAFDSARTTWESVRDLDLRDIEANTWLGTIYQRLGDLVQSDQALKRVLGRKELENEKRAEIHSLLGRNAKARWVRQWEGSSATEIQIKALNSAHIDESYEAYEGAFHEDLNHFYSGLNALAMLAITIELAKLLPNEWAERFDDDSEAVRALEQREALRNKLAAAVTVSIEAAKIRLDREGKKDIWVEISEADLYFLTSQRPRRVASAYRHALSGAPDFAVDAARRQILLYDHLGILSDNTAAALSVTGGPAPERHVEDTTTLSTPRRVLLFTGHMIDAPGRSKPRFPPDKVGAAETAMRKAISDESERSGGIAYGIAGCASGGDILFHQLCEKWNIPTRIFLALPRDQYVKTSVAHAGPSWIDEFHQLCKSRQVRVLGQSNELPRWLQEKSDYNIWQRSNLWMLYNALAAGSENVTLIALWDGESGDGPGGTADMVEKARDRGAKTIILNTKEIFEM